MARKPTGKNPPHRPQKEIPWEKVEQMSLSGCSGLEIAGAFGICSDTFYRRFEDKYGVTYSAYVPNRKLGGHAMLRHRQFQSAMAGNTQMLKMLGEEWLGQGKKIEGLVPNDEKLDDLINSVKERADASQRQTDPVIQ